MSGDEDPSVPTRFFIATEVVAGSCRESTNSKEISIRVACNEREPGGAAPATYPECCQGVGNSVNYNDDELFLLRQRQTCRESSQ